MTAAAPDPSARRVEAVLFACTLNRVRSPMAASLLRRLSCGRLYVDSCGVRPGGDEDPFVRTVLAEAGLEPPAETPKTFEGANAAQFDLIICLSEEAYAAARAATRALSCEVEFWPTPDPTLEDGSRDLRLGAYRRTRDELSARIRRRFAAATAGA